MSVTVTYVAQALEQSPLQEIHLSDGRILGPLHRRTVEQFAIVTGMTLDEDSESKLMASERKRLLREAALTYLSYSAHTSAEVIRYLKRKFPAAAIEAQGVVDQLLVDGYLDDRALCERVVQQSLAQGAKESRQALQYRLLRRGLGKDLIQEVLSTEGQYEEYTGALQLAQKKLAEIDRKLAARKGKVLDADDAVADDMDVEQWRVAGRRRSQLAGYLARKGYAPTTIGRIIEELIG